MAISRQGIPGLQDDAKEQLSLDRFLTLLDKRKLVLAVRQRRPKTLDDIIIIIINYCADLCTECISAQNNTSYRRKNYIYLT